MTSEYDILTNTQPYAEDLGVDTQNNGESPEFKFIEFNPRRKARGVEAARVAVDGEWLWMSKRDIQLNIRDFGPHPELLRALESYK